MWQRLIRRGLLALSVVFASSLVYLLITRSETGSSPHPISPVALGRADAGINQFTFKQSKHGQVQWEVRAERAQLFKEENRAVLDAVEVTLFGRNGHDLHVKGDRGTIDTVKRNFVIMNQGRPVVVELEGGYTILTNHLAWADEQETLHTEDPVTIVGHGMEVMGRGLIGKLDSEEFQVQHDVHVEMVP